MQLTDLANAPLVITLKPVALQGACRYQELGISAQAYWRPLPAFIAFAPGQENPSPGAS